MDADLTDAKGEGAAMSTHQYVIVEIIRDQNTRRAHLMHLLYGPYGTDTPGTDDELRCKWARDRAEDDMQKMGLEGYEVTSVRVLRPIGATP